MDTLILKSKLYLLSCTAIKSNMKTTNFVDLIKENIYKFSS